MVSQRRSGGPESSDSPSDTDFDDRTRQTQRAELDEMLQRLESAHQEIAALRSSTSWRLTAPLRALAISTRSIFRAPNQLGANLLVFARRTWRRLPIDAQKRAQLHVLARRRMPALYHRWVTHWPLPAIQTSVVAHVRPLAGDEPAEAQLPDRPTSMRLWDDYPGLKTRLAQERRAHRESKRTEPLNIIDLTESELGRRLGELSFPFVANPEISIVIPVFNKLKLTAECLISIARAWSTTYTTEVIVADDCSQDESLDRLRRVPNLVYLRNQTNLGFVRNCNGAAARARGKYLVFLNNDVQVFDHWLDRLREAFEKDGVGVAGPKFAYPNGRLQEAGGVIRSDGSTRMVGLFDALDEPAYAFDRNVDYCSGACLMVASKTFAEVGGFSDEFAPAYCEDVDLCLKVRARNLSVRYVARAMVMHHLSATTSQLSAISKTRSIARNRLRLIEHWQSDLAEIDQVRVIAFYLPQFHPIPENDLWWGKGFTEWTNVAKARPNFNGHYQPHLPADLGFYDLRVAETLDAQIQLARRYGLFGFCFYYYWFDGKRLLEMPLERMLHNEQEAFPYCICWANENWTRRWDGMDSEVLMSQSHSESDDHDVIEDMARYLRSPHYIRIGGRPLILVYRVNEFPRFRQTVEIWRRYCRREGIGEIYVAMVESFTQAGRAVTPREFGCDAAVEFPPHNFGDPRRPSTDLSNPKFVGHVHDYCDMVSRYVNRPGVSFTRFRGVMPAWDNTPRRQDNSEIFVNASPGAFQAWLEVVVEQTKARLHGDERIIFVNAWNEWAEGAHLEPDQVYGHAWLEAVQNAIDSQSRNNA